jgi:hypothetical protein
VVAKTSRPRRPDPGPGAALGGDDVDRLLGGRGHRQRSGEQLGKLWQQNFFCRQLRSTVAACRQMAGFCKKGAGGNF